MSVQLDDMKVFCDVVETGSFSRAGALNSVTQTAVSRKIQAIEESVGCRLIDRSKGRRGHAPTPAGEIYYDGCREILARYREIVERIGETRGEVSGTVRVETVYSVGLHELPQHVKEFMRRYPQAKIHIEYNRTNRIYDNCLSERADLGIVAYPTEQPRIGVIELNKDRMVLICAPDNRLARRRSVTFADLGGMPFIGFEKDIPTRRAVDRHSSAAGVSLDVRMEFDNIETIKRSVEVGLGVSVVPRNTVQQEVRVGTLAAVPIAPAIDRPVGIIFKRGRPFTLTARRFIEVVRGAEES
jgi:LysR family transcriptional regulator, transcriptional activator of the cysJI operon